MAATIIIGTIVIGLMVLVVVRMVRKARKGDLGCSCGCGGCDLCAPQKDHSKV